MEHKQIINCNCFETVIKCIYLQRNIKEKISISTATTGKGVATRKPVSSYLSLLVQPFPVVALQFEPPAIYAHP